MKPATILLVDDDVHALSFLRRCLESQPEYQVLFSCSADGALRICASHRERIDLLLTDVNLDSGHGHELARKLCLMRTDMRVLFISGGDAGDLAARGLLDRRAAFLQKPFRARLLLDIVSAMLESEEATSPGAF